MIYDLHVHCFPEQLAARAVPYLAEKGGIPAFTDGTIKGLKASMREAGIELGVVQPVSTKPAQVVGINRWACQARDDTLEFFGTVHPDFTSWKEEIRWLAKNGFKGIKFHPDYQDFFVDEKRMYPIYEAVFSAGLVILFHTGLDVGFPPPYHCTPERLARVVRDFPGGRIVAAHLGGYEMWDSAETHLVGKDLYFDASCATLGLEPEKFMSIIRAHGVDKVCFATDSPWTPQRETVAFYDTLDFTPEERRLIFSENAARLLALTPQVGECELFLEESK